MFQIDLVVIRKNVASRSNPIDLTGTIPALATFARTSANDYRKFRSRSDELETAQCLS